MHLRPLALTLLLAACAGQSVPPQANAAKSQPSFATFIKQLQQDAAAQGLPAQYIADAFGSNPQPYLQVVRSQENQPEIKDAFAQYLNRILSNTRITTGREKLALHKDELTAVASQSGVPAEVIVALWGTETAYGKVTGNIPVIKALATLAYTDERRPEFFRRELFGALKVATQTGRDAKTLKGSWAGALGQNQFMPTNWAKLGVDGDGDGTVNLFDSTADVFASTANYLKRAGWQSGQGWKWNLSGPVTLPPGVKVNDRGLSERFPVVSLPKNARPVHLQLPPNALVRTYQPQGAGGPAYLLGPNFDVILDWNYSSYFSFSVLTLADTLKSES